MPRQLPNKLSTQRLHLRRPFETDAEEIFRAYAQDAKVCRYMIWAPHSSAKQTQVFIASCIEAWRAEDRLPYVLAEQGSNLPIGMLEARIQGNTVDIGYVLSRDHWGKRFMSEAIQSLTAAALGVPEIFRVQATCDTQNIQSQRALEKSGFAREGRLERYIVHPNISSEPRACFMYARCK